MEGWQNALEVVCREADFIVDTVGTYFFILGLVNSISLILIFIIRKNRLDLIRRFGWTYLLLSIPAILGIFLAVQGHQFAQHGVFLVIFLGFMLVEWLYDYVFKTNFRQDMRRNWKAVTPYLALYYAMNYGFIVLPWKASIVWGLVMLCLFLAQLVVNLRSHPWGNADRDF